MIDKIRKFMSGRYGADELYRFQLIIYLIIIVLNIFIKSRALFVVELIILASILFRITSKKIYKRKRENQIYLKVKKIILKPFSVINKNIKDKNHIYKKCRKCGKVLRLPLPFERGIKHTVCPHCSKKLTIIALKYEKVEIIKNTK